MFKSVITITSLNLKTSNVSVYTYSYQDVLFNVIDGSLVFNEDSKSYYTFIGNLSLFNKELPIKFKRAFNRFQKGTSKNLHIMYRDSNNLIQHLTFKFEVMFE